MTPDEEAGIIAGLSSPHLDRMAADAMTASGRGAAREILRKRERAITGAMRRYLHRETLVAVKLQRPRWMPAWIYRRLLSSIVIEERATRSPEAQRRNRR